MHIFVEQLKLLGLSNEEIEDVDDFVAKKLAFDDLNPKIKNALKGIYFQ